MRPQARLRALPTRMVRSQASPARTSTRLGASKSGPKAPTKSPRRSPSKAKPVAKPVAKAAGKAAGKAAHAGKAGKGMLARYKALLERHPLLANCIQAAVIAGCADVTRQLAFADAPVSAISALRQMLVIFSVNVPMTYAIYSMYDRMRLELVARLVLDQFVMCWLTNSTTMSAMHVLNGRPPAALLHRFLGGELVAVVKNSWKVWVPAKTLMFAVTSRSPFSTAGRVPRVPRVPRLSVPPSLPARRRPLAWASTRVAEGLWRSVAVCAASLSHTVPVSRRVLLADTAVAHAQQVTQPPRAARRGRTGMVPPTNRRVRHKGCHSAPCPCVREHARFACPYAQCAASLHARIHMRHRVATSPQHAMGPCPA